MAKTQHQPALPRIFTVRGKKVVLDSDLARLYGVPTFRLNEAVKRNAARFPQDFSFYLRAEELVNLISQNAISSSEASESLSSPPAILKTAGGRRKPTRVFTEHGALMAANILRSRKAIEMSLYLIRAFVQMRETLQTNTTILKRLAEIDHRLIEHDSVLREIVEQLQPLLDAPEPEDDAKPKIGFHPGNR
jgi:hypothetical protein